MQATRSNAIVDQVVANHVRSTHKLRGGLVIVFIPSRVLALAQPREIATVVVEQARGSRRLISLRTQYRKDFCAIVDLAARAKAKLPIIAIHRPVRGDEVALQ
jgi:hypothetical protein